MKAVLNGVIALCVCSVAHADFSYTQTRRTTGGMMAGMGRGAAPSTSRVLIKGQKMKTEDSNGAVIIDLDAQTITTILTAQKSYTVKNFSDVAAGNANLNASVDLKETGQKKNVNGFDATEAVMTIQVDTPQMGKAQIEMDMWLSSDVPGSQELRSFYSKNADKFPWAALGGGGNPGLSSALADVQKKMASMKAVPVQQIMRMKAPTGMAGGAPAGPSAAQMGQAQAGMEKARRQLEAMVAQGGPAAAMAKQQLDRMGPAPGAAAASPAASNYLMEMTIDSSGFSSAGIPDSEFSVPADYKKN